MTRGFKETIQARALKDPEFRKGLLAESVENMLEGDIETGKSLMRMFSSKGNPTAQNLFVVLRTLTQQENVQFQVNTL